MSKLLALDQAHTTGYTILDGNKIVKVGHFECRGADLGDRLVQLRENISKLIKDYDIDEVVFEDIQLQDVNGNKETGIKTFKILAEVLGVLCELLQVYGVVYEYLTEIGIKNSSVLPIKWKAHFKIAGKGRAQEKMMSKAYVKKTYGINCTEDEADSLCIAMWYRQNTNIFDWSE